MSHAPASSARPVHLTAGLNEGGARTRSAPLLPLFAPPGARTARPGDLHETRRIDVSAKKAAPHNLYETRPSSGSADSGAADPNPNPNPNPNPSPQMMLISAPRIDVAGPYSSARIQQSKAKLAARERTGLHELREREQAEIHLWQMLDDGMTDRRCGTQRRPQ